MIALKGTLRRRLLACALAALALTACALPPPNFRRVHAYAYRCAKRIRADSSIDDRDCAHAYRIGADNNPGDVCARPNCIRADSIPNANRIRGDSSAHNCAVDQCIG